MISAKCAEPNFTKANIPTADFAQRASNCILLTITVICIGILTVCGVMIVREYALGKGYERTTCQVESVEYDRNDMTCSFCSTEPKQKQKKQGEKGHCIQSSFPCLKVNVAYHANGKTQEGIMHPDTLQAAGPYSKVICLISHLVHS